MLFRSGCPLGSLLLLEKAEGKLVACTVTESSAYSSDGDSAWFDIDVTDKDSMEHIYLTFTFRFSTREE